MKKFILASLISAVSFGAVANADDGTGDYGESNEYKTLQSVKVVAEFDKPHYCGFTQSSTGGMEDKTTIALDNGVVDPDMHEAVYTFGSNTDSIINYSISVDESNHRENDIQWRVKTSDSPVYKEASQAVSGDINIAANGTGTLSTYAVFNGITDVKGIKGSGLITSTATITLSCKDPMNPDTI